jgi:hypothetical protein
LYLDLTGDPAPLAELAATLDQLPHRHRRAIELRAGGAAWRQVGQKLHLTTGGAAALVTRAFNRANKQMLKLPRYHQIGHPPPMKTKPHDPHKAAAEKQCIMVTRKLAHAADPPPRDAKGRIVKRTGGALGTTPEIKPPHPLPY